MTKILMVCLGNICRSPLAEGILKSKLSTKDYIVDSAGTGNYHIGKLPDPRSVAIAREFSIDITDQRCRQFKVKDFDTFDIIYAMDNSNFRNILKLARDVNDQKKVKLILNEVYKNQNFDIPDPYSGGIEGFKNVFMLLDEACDIIVKNLK